MIILHLWSSRPGIPFTYFVAISLEFCILTDSLQLFWDNWFNWSRVSRLQRLKLSAHVMGRSNSRVFLNTGPMIMVISHVLRKCLIWAKSFSLHSSLGGPFQLPSFFGINVELWSVEQPQLSSSDRSNIFSGGRACRWSLVGWRKDGLSATAIGWYLGIYPKRMNMEHAQAIERGKVW